MYRAGQDLRYGARLLWKAPGFTVAALAALTLGIGAATAIFSVVDAVLLKPLPFASPERLLAIWERSLAQNKSKLAVAGGNFLEWSRQSRTLEGVAAYQDDVHVNLTGGPKGPIDPEELAAQRITAGLFPLLGVKPIVGRVFRSDEDQPGRTNFALLSYGLWQRRFGADAAIASQSIRLRDQSYTVIGVMPAGTRIMNAAADVWIPLGLDASDPRTVRFRFLTAIARLKRGATLEQARAEMELIGNRLEQADPALDRGWRPSVYPLREELVGDVTRPLLVLSGAVGFLLLIACVNVANLLLARGAGRSREIAIRTAVGASRGRIAAQLLSESILLALAAGALALPLAWGGVALLARLGQGSIPRLAEARLDWRLFLFGLAASLATGILFGIAPAIHGSGANPVTALMESGRGRTASRSGRMLRDALVISEMALAVLVLIGAGLLIRSFARLRAVDPGFQPAGLLTFRLPLSGVRNASADRRIAFVNQAVDRIATLPGVRSVAAVNTLPLAGFGLGSLFTVGGRPAPPPAERPQGLLRAVTPAYFHTMGIPLTAGRAFTASDTSEKPLVLVVDQTLAQRFWPQGSALGGRLALDPGGRVGEIVGVAGAVKPERIQDEDWPTIYCPHAQYPLSIMVMAVRTEVPPMALASAVERAVHQLDAEQPVGNVRPAEAVIDQAVAAARFQTVVLALFAQIAFVLAAVGVYGVVAYDVSQRTHEIGIRLALGAQPGDVRRLILGQCARLAAWGIAAGLAAAFGLTRLMANMLYSVKPTDGYTFASMAMLLGAVALMASYLPSRRAMALQPAAALRHD